MKSLLPLAACTLFASAASAAQVWTAPAATKVRPSTQPAAGAPTGAAIAAAKNEFESFHVVVTGAARGVSMSLDALADAQGHSIAGRDLVLYREAIINVAQPSGGDGAAGAWPDALVPDVDPIAGETRNAFPFDVADGESRAVLVDVHVPADAAAGAYTGTLHVTSASGATADVPVTLTVWDFAMPSTSTLKSAFGMAWNGPCLGHGDANCTDTVRENAVRGRYLQAALDNRMTISIASMGAPVAQDGTADWASFDAAWGPFYSGAAPTRLQGARLTTAQVLSAQGAPSAQQVASWSQHFTAQGWSAATTVFNYVCDEPPLTCAWADINGRIAASHAGDPSVPTLVTTTAQQAKDNGVAGLDLFAPVVNFVEDRPGTDHAGSQRAQYGANVWWYQSCMSFGCVGVGGGLDATGLTGWPSYAIDADGTRNRAMEWLSFAYGMTGELYYETTMAYFGSDPWTNQYNFGGTGDGNLFYPGTPARIGGQTEIPIESLRMKGIRDGMEDYELLAMAKGLGLGDQAAQIAAGVYPKTYQATTTAQALEAARAELAQLILHALGKDQPAPQPTPDPTPQPAPDPQPAPTPAPPTDPAQTNTTVTIGDGSTIYGMGGCSSSGAQSAWLALPLVGLLTLRVRRRRAQRA